jgi:8-oxo-dGTP pyrophosphatase MutT (NUDIX family)
MADEPKKTKAAVNAAIWHESKILVIGRKKWLEEKTPFLLPGGGVNAHETQDQALVRELEEEIGFIPTAIRKHWAIKFFSCKTEWTDKLIICECHEDVIPDIELDYQKFFGLIWLDTANKQMLELFWPQLMPGLRMYLKDKLDLQWPK